MGLNAVRSQIYVMCIAYFFINLALWQDTKTNEVCIFKQLKSKIWVKVTE